MRLKWLASLLVVAAPIAASAQITLTAEAPGVQSTQDATATTETFDGFTAGNYNSLATAVGTLAAPAGQTFNIHAADAFGGAGGTGNYFVVGAESGYLTATLTLPGEEEYMGLWLSALDANNEIQLYNNGSLVATYNPNAVLALVSGNPAYYGNPNNGEDSGEPFAYLNFIGSATTQFNSVVFSNANLARAWRSTTSASTPPPPARPARSSAAARAYRFRRRPMARRS